MKSRKYYRIAFSIGLLLLPFVIVMNKDDFRNFWFLIPMGVVTLTMFFFAFKAIKLEERGE